MNLIFILSELLLLAQQADPATSLPTLLTRLLSAMAALILVLAPRLRTFEADGDALAQRLSDQIPGGQRQLLAWGPLSISWKTEAEQPGW